jgi:FKBP-type peptidyl-prolyl cis-trans isomerase
MNVRPRSGTDLPAERALVGQDLAEGVVRVVVCAVVVNILAFRDALVGQSVGSRVVVIIPAALGYGPNGGTEDGSIGPEDTIVFVIDILGIQ